jgi:hypothetical protein
MIVRRPALGGAVLALGLVLAACSADDGSTVTPSPDPDGPVVVTFEVAGGETFKALLTDPADIGIARQLLAGEPAPGIPNGVVVRGETSVNDGYSWSYDPEQFEFADMTIEVCDGLPSDVEAGLVTSDRYCPWSAQVIAIEPAPGG